MGSITVKQCRLCQGDVVGEDVHPICLAREELNLPSFAAKMCRHKPISMVDTDGILFEFCHACTGTK